MSILRKLLLVFLAGLLPFFLFTLAIDAGILHTAGSSAPIKKVLADSGIYSSVVPAVLEQSKDSSNNSGGLNLNDPNVKAAAGRIFTPQYLQQNTENILDSIYRWLDGKTTVPDFRIDIASLKGAFANESAKLAQEKAASLPKCPTALSGGSDSFDPFSAQCLPASVTPAQAGAKVQDNINSEDFWKNSAITADSLKDHNNPNQSVFSGQLKDAPMQYQKVKKTPVILAVLSFLTILGVIFLSASRQLGLRRVGISLLIIGAFLLLFAWAINYGVNQKALANINISNKGLQEKVRTLVSDLTRNLDRTYWIFGGSYAALGTLAIVGSMFMGRKPGQVAAEEGPHEEAPSPVTEHKPEAPKPKPPPPPSPKRKIKIQ